MRRIDERQGCLTLQDGSGVSVSTQPPGQIRYAWFLPAVDAAYDPGPYRVRAAHPREAQLVLRVVIGAYASDPAWRPLSDAARRWITNRVSTTIGAPGVTFLVGEFGGRIVGTCGVAHWHWSGCNLLTGICLDPAHRSQGLGQTLLGAALERLRDDGVREAVARARTGSWDDRLHFRVFVPADRTEWREIAVPRLPAITKARPAPWVGA